MAAVKFDKVRSIAFGSVTNAYSPLGTPLTQNWRIMKITNTSDADMFLSVDGVNDNIFVPASGFVLYDLACNALNVQDSDWFVMAINSQFYVKYSTAPTKGSVYIEGIFSTGV